MCSYKHFSIIILGKKSTQMNPQVNYPRANHAFAQLYGIRHWDIYIHKVARLTVPTTIKELIFVHTSTFISLFLQKKSTQMNPKVNYPSANHAFPQPYWIRHRDIYIQKVAHLTVKLDSSFNSVNLNMLNCKNSYYFSKQKINLHLKKDSRWLNSPEYPLLVFSEKELIYIDTRSSYQLFFMRTTQMNPKVFI